LYHSGWLQLILINHILFVMISIYSLTFDLRSIWRSHGEAIVLEILKGYQAFTQVCQFLLWTLFFFFFFLFFFFFFLLYSICMTLETNFELKMILDWKISQACGILRAVEPLNSFLASLCKFTINFPAETERKR